MGQLEQERIRLENNVVYGISIERADAASIKLQRNLIYGMVSDPYDHDYEDVTIPE